MKNKSLLIRFNITKAWSLAILMLSSLLTMVVSCPAQDGMISYKLFSTGYVNSAGMEFANRKIKVKGVHLMSYVQLNRFQNNPEIFPSERMMDTRVSGNFSLQPKVSNRKKSFFEVSSGLFAYGQTLYGGFSITHLTSPDNFSIETGTQKALTKMNVHAGAVIRLREKKNPATGAKNQVTLSPNILLQRQGKLNRVTMGTYFHQSDVVCGVWFSGTLDEKRNIHSDSIILFAGLRKGWLQLGYSYNYSMGKNTTDPSGWHELSLRICSVK